MLAHFVGALPWAHWPFNVALEDMACRCRLEPSAGARAFLGPEDGTGGAVVLPALPVPGARARDANPAKPPEKKHSRSFPLSTPSISNSTPCHFPSTDLQHTQTLLRRAFNRPSIPSKDHS